MMTFDPLQLMLFETGAAESNLSAGAFRANRPALRESAGARETIDGSGRIFCDWCGRSSPCGCWRRTCQDSLLSSLMALTGLSLKWKPRDISASRLLWVLGRSAHRTGGTACGSSGDWKTPRANESGQYQYDQGDKTKPRPTLTGQVKEWPTPRARDVKGQSQRGKDAPGDCLPNAVLFGPPDPASLNTHGRPRGSLNSRWVAQLMGFPSDWCDLPTETLSRLTGTRSSRRS